MRISDWSSDVCSSDLLRVLGQHDAEHRQQALHFIHRQRFAGDAEIDPQLLAAVVQLPGQRQRGGTEAELTVADLTAAGSEVVAGAMREANRGGRNRGIGEQRSEEHTSELQSLMRISYAVFCLKKKNKQKMTDE